MLLLSLVLAHLVADFILQTDEMVRNKLKYLLKHMLHHFILYALILVGFWLFNQSFDNIVEIVIFPLIFIIISHYFIDLLKIKFGDSFKIGKGKNSKLLYFFILDQLLHIFTLIFSGYVFFKKDVLKITMNLFSVENSRLAPINSLLLICIIAILATTVSGHFIRILLGSIPNQLLTFEGKYGYKNEWKSSKLNVKGLTEEYYYSVFSKHDLSRGKLIGYIERLLVILLTFYNAFPAIGFIVAAKSIARFKQMDDRDWAEYFLLGTLASMFLGITLGIILREALT